MMEFGGTLPARGSSVQWRGSFRSGELYLRGFRTGPRKIVGRVFIVGI